MRVFNCLSKLFSLFSTFTALSLIFPSLLLALPNVDKAVEQEMILQNIPGAIIGIVKNGQVIYTKAYGDETLARSQSVSVNKVFNWASISKTVTAVSALQTFHTLRTTKVPGQSFNFSFNATIDHYIDDKDWPKGNSKDIIRFRHLLSNRSGVRHYNELPDYCLSNDNVPNYDLSKHPSSKFNESQALAMFKAKPLCTSPGSRYQYSTFGFSLLAAALKGAMGKPYSQLVEETIKNYTFNGNKNQLISLSQATDPQEGFARSCGIIHKATHRPAANVLPGGGWRSTINDLALFANGLMHDHFAKRTSQLWHSNPNPSGSFDYQYGIEHRLWGTTGQEAIGHGGTHDSSRTQFLIFPSRSDKLGVVVYANTRHANIKRLAMIIANVMGTRLVLSEFDNRCEQSCSGLFSALWRRTNQSVFKRLGYTTDDFKGERRYMRNRGYHLTDFEAYYVNGSLKWDGIYRQGKKETVFVSNLDRNQFGRKWQQMRKDNYLLMDVETYSRKGRRLWAGLFYKEKGQGALFRFLNTKDFGRKHTSLAKQGFKLIDVEPFHEHGRLKWAGVWIGGKASLLNRGFNTADFGNLRSTREKQGWKLIDIERYLDNDKELWAGVWEKSPVSERLNRKYPFCGSKTNNNWTKLGITNRHHQWQKAGFEMIDWERN